MRPGPLNALLSPAKLDRCIPGPRAVLLALAWAILPAPAGLRAQAEEETSIRQFGMRDPGPAEQPAGAPSQLEPRFPLDAPPDDL